MYVLIVSQSRSKAIDSCEWSLVNFLDVNRQDYFFSCGGDWLPCFGHSGGASWTILLVITRRVHACANEQSVLCPVWANRPFASLVYCSVWHQCTAMKVIKKSAAHDKTRWENFRTSAIYFLSWWGYGCFSDLLLCSYNREACSKSRHLPGKSGELASMSVYHAELPLRLSSAHVKQRCEQQKKKTSFGCPIQSMPMPFLRNWTGLDDDIQAAGGQHALYFLLKLAQMEQLLLSCTCRQGKYLHGGQDLASSKWQIGNQSPHNKGSWHTFCH